jgi:elongation factor Ts
LSSVITYKPPAEEVKRLRDDTGAGMIDCRNALVRANGDFDAAKRELGELGQARAARKSERTANEGLVGSYVHAGGKIGALVEVNCETDFVARSPRFGELVKDIAMHVAAMSPTYVSRDQVPSEIVDGQRAELRKGAPADKKPEVIERIVEGKLNKWFEEHVLLDQAFIKNDDQTVGELIGSAIGVLGEKIAVRRFAKFALGEGDASA